MRPSLLAFAFIAVSACTRMVPVAPSPGPWRLSGTISTLDGGGVLRPIAGSELIVVEGANLNARVTSDAAGRYVFDALDGGRFTLAITAPGYVGINPLVHLYRDTAVDFALKPQ
jgi:hypothetical protein